MIFELKDAEATRGNETLFRGISLCAQPGDAVAVVGKAEASKALLSAMLGLRPLQKGWVSVDGEPVTSATGAYFRQFVAYQPEELNFEELSVEEVARKQFALKVNGEYAYTAKGVAEELARLGVEKNVLEARFCDIEPAIAERVVLALAGMFERKLLLLDNPTSHQDEEGRKQVVAFVERKRSEGMAVVVATADDELLAVCNKVVRLQRSVE